MYGNRSITTTDEFEKNFVRRTTEPLLVLSFHEAEDESNRECLFQYGTLIHYISILYPFRFLSVKCPSEACDRLNTNTFLSIDKYGPDLELVANAPDGLDVEQYMEVALSVERRRPNRAKSKSFK